MCPHSNLRKPPLNFVVAMTEFLSLPSGFLSREVLRDICGTAVDISFPSAKLSDDHIILGETEGECTGGIFITEHVLCMTYGASYVIINKVNSNLYYFSYKNAARYTGLDNSTVACRVVERGRENLRLPPRHLVED